METVTELPSRGPFRGFRGAAIIAGRGFIAERPALRARYRAALPDEVRATLDALAVGDWVPCPVLEAHYRSMDALDLSTEVLEAQGRAVGDANWGTYMRTVAHLAGRLGATPWQAFRRGPRLFARHVDGGGFRILRLGTRRARLELQDFGPSFAASDAFVHSVLGSWIAGCLPFAPTRGRPVERSAARVAYELTWH